jgi:hypothetical protein
MSPDEQTVAFSAGDGSCFGGLVRLLKTYSPQEAPVEFQLKPTNSSNPFQDGQACPMLLAYSPEGTLAVAGRSQSPEDQGLLAMYDGTTGELLERVDLGPDGLPWFYGALTYSNDGQTLAMGGTKITNRPEDDNTPWEEKDVLMLYDVLNKTVTAEIDLGAVLDTPGDDWYQIRAAWSPNDQYIVGTSWDWYSTVLGVFDAATGALLDKFSINMDESGVNHQTRVDFVGFTGDCGDGCQDLVASATLQEGDKKDETYKFANNLTYYDVVTLDADDARCQPTPAPVPAPHHSDGATALAAGLAVPALAALAL